MSESEILRAFDRIWERSNIRTAIIGRLGLMEQTPDAIPVVGRPGYVHVTMGDRADQGVTIAKDRVDVAMVVGQQVRMRRENGELVIYEAAAYRTGDPIPPAPMSMFDLTNVQSTGWDTGEVPTWDAATSTFKPVFPPTGGGGGGGTYTAGLGINISVDNIISAKSNTDRAILIDATGIGVRASLDGGLAAGPPGLHIFLQNPSGMSTSTLGLGIGGGQGIDVLSTSVRVDVTDIIDTNKGLSEVGATNKIQVKIDPAGGLQTNVNGIAMNDPDTLTFDSVNFKGGTGNVGHTHDVASSADVSVSAANILLHSSLGKLGLKTLDLRGDINFINGVYNIISTHDLKIKPKGNLYIESTPTGYVWDDLNPPVPRKNIMFPDDQVLRTSNAQNMISGIDGWEIAWMGGYKSQLTISELLVDNLYARKFVADEARVQRGEWFLTRSYGIVETTFEVPAINANVDVWFEEAPGLDGHKLFLVDNWIQFRTIDWETNLVIQTVNFIVIDAGVNDYVNRVTQTPEDERPSRQLWRLKRREGGFTGAFIHKGETGVDFGQPPTVEEPHGQGVVYATSLFHPNKGPYIQVQTFDAIAGNAPHFLNKVRMGNLNGVLGNTTDTYGLAAGNSLAKVPGDGFIGISINEDGADFYDTNLTMYQGSIESLIVKRDTGISMRFDSLAGNDPLRNITWYDDIANPPTEGFYPAAFITAAFWDRGGGHLVRELGMTMMTSSELVEEASISLQAANYYDEVFASLNLSTKSMLSTGVYGEVASLMAEEVKLGRNVHIGFSDHISSSQLNITNAGTETGRKVGVTIEQQGTWDPGGGAIGDAVLHFRMHQYDPDNYPVFMSDQWYSIGIDSTFPRKFRISASERLGTNDFFTFDPSTGQVTIPGFSASGSPPPTGFTAGDGIILAGSNISVNASVARTTTTITAGNGLTGGGTLAGPDILIQALTQSGSGLTVSASGIFLNDALAGTGLDMAPGKIMNIDPAYVALAATSILPGNGMYGGGTLAATRTLGIQLAAPYSGLAFDVNNDLWISDSIAGLGLIMTNKIMDVDNTIARSAITFFTNAGSGLTGGGNLTANRTLAVDFDDVVSTTTQIKTLAGSGLTGGAPLTGDVTLAVDFTQVARASALIVTPLNGGIQGGAPISTNPSLTVDDTVVRTDLQILTPPTGGLIGGGPLTGDLELSLDFSKVLTTDYTITAGDGLTGGGTLATPMRFDVGPGNGILVTANTVDVKPYHGIISDTLGVWVKEDNGILVGATGVSVKPYQGITVDPNGVAVNRAYAFDWTGIQSWAQTATFNAMVYMSAGAQFNTGVYTFNTNPQISGDLNFIGGARKITSPAATILSINSGGDLVINPGNLIAPYAKMLPTSSGKIDIGYYNRKWRSLYASELYVETLVASSVMATIGGRVMIAPTSNLIADLAAASGAGTIDVKHDMRASWFQNTYLYMEGLNPTTSLPQQEALKITSTTHTVITDGYRWSVTRNVDGGPTTAWQSGDAIVSLGKNVGDGYIDLSSLTTLHGKIGPTITVYSRSATALWNDTVPVVSMGSLAGWGDLSDGFGFAAADDLTKSPADGLSGIAMVTGSVANGGVKNGIKLWNVDFRLYQSQNTIFTIDKVRGISMKFGSAEYNSIGWYEEMGDGITTFPSKKRGTVGLDKKTVGGLAYSVAEIFSYGLSHDSYTRGAVRLAGINSTTTVASNIWLDSTGAYFGSGNVATTRSETAAFIRDDLTYIAHQLGVGTTTIIPSTAVAEFRGGSVSTIRLGRGTHPNLRSDWSVSATSTTLNSYNDNNLLYYPLNLSGSHVISYIDGVEAMRVHNDGNVGIGTISPGALLHVEGAAAGIRISRTSDAVGVEPYLIFYKGTTPAALAQIRGLQGGGLRYTNSNGGTEWMRIVETGEVGIGTDTPIYLLHVSKSQGAVTNITSENPSTAAGAVASLSARSGAASATMGVLGSGYGVTGPMTSGDAYITGGSTRLVLRTIGANDMIFATNNVEEMRITAAGDLGFGIAAPAYYVHIKKDQATSTTLMMENLSTGAGALAQVAVRGVAGTSGVFGMMGSGWGTSGPLTNGDVSLAANAARLVIRTVNAHDLIFGTSNVERMRIESTGDIGIGTTNPDHSLHIYDNSTAISAVGLKIQQAGAGDARLQFTQQTTNWTIGIDGSLADAFAISPSTDLSSVTGATIKTTGYMGINNTAPGALLHVGPGTVGAVSFYTGGIQISPNVSVASIHLKNSLGQEMGMFAHSNGNNYIGSWSNHDLSLRTNALDRLTILAAGNVGIGNIAPAYKLEVTGTLRATGLITASAGINFGQSTLTYFESGVYTPDVRFANSAAGVTYQSRSGSWIRIGNLVVIMYEVSLMNKGSLSSGAAELASFPFVVPDNTVGGSVNYLNLSVTTFSSMVLRGIAGSNSARFFAAPAAGAASMSQVTNASFSNNTFISGYFIYTI